MVDELLGSEAFVDFWTMKLADLLLLNGQGPAAKAWHGWLREQVAGNASLRPYRPRVSSPPPAIRRRMVPPASCCWPPTRAISSEHVGRIFLGSQIGCARCHAHPTRPLDAGGLSSLRRLLRPDQHVMAVRSAPVIAARWMIRRPGTRLSQGHSAQREIADRTPDRRLASGRLMTDPANPLFARTIVNRVWKHLLGRGLVEPVDDLRPTNPATHPGAARCLGGGLHGAWLRSAPPRPLDRRIPHLATRLAWWIGRCRRGRNSYARAQLKPLSAAVFVDAVAQVTSVPDVFAGYPSGTRAVQLISPAHAVHRRLDVLGRCERKRSCDTLVQQRRWGLAQALHLLNGSTINDKLHGGLATELHRAGQPRSDRGALISVPSAASPRQASWPSGMPCYRRMRSGREAVADLHLGRPQLPRVCRQSLRTHAMNLRSFLNRCDGVSRRDFLHLGVLTSFGISLPGLLRMQAAAAEPGKGSPRAKSCILIWLDGGPSHLDMFDLKPEAPSEVRSQFKAINTAVSGVQICEHLQRTAAVMKDVALIRSLTHELGNHDTGARFLLTGHRPTPALEYPSLGSLVSHAAGQERNHAALCGDSSRWRRR